MLIRILLFSISLIGYGYAQSQCTDLNDESEIIEKKTTNDFEFTCEQEYGYKFLITVENVDVSENYLLIKAGTLEDSDGEGVLFTHTWTKEKKSFVFASNVFSIKLRTIDAKFINKFKITYQRIGTNIITTTENPFSTTLWPDPQPGDRVHITVNVAGYRNEDYKKKALQEKFKTAVVAMATEYCKNNNIELNAEITGSNVALAEMQSCPYNWPNTDECVQIRFAVSVSAKNTSRGYELKAGHLEQMWEHYEDQLKLLGFSIYRLPEYSKTMIGWAVPMAIIILIIVIIMGIIFAINYFKIVGHIESKEENMNDRFDDRVNANDGMYPDQNQETGDIIENQSYDRSFQYDNVVNLSDDSETEI